MGRRQRGRAINGIVLLDKPAGISSNRALQRVRGILDARKAGHTGSLDPFATGMLPVCFGHATRFSQYLLDAGKAYSAVAQLGQATATGDPEGEVISTAPVPECSPARLETALQGLRGEISQVPPMYSALKHQGRRLYELAREGKEVARPARVVTIHELSARMLDNHQLALEVICSKGTYIRTLVEDLARALGTLAHTVMLRRRWVAPFDGHEMTTLESLQAAPGDTALLPVDFALQGLPRVELSSADGAAIRQGREVAADRGEQVWDQDSSQERVHPGLKDAVRLYCQEDFIGLARQKGAVLAPFKVLPEAG